MDILKFIILFLSFNVFDKITASFYSRFYYIKCKGDCSKCGNWACVNETKYSNKNYYLGIYDNYKNVCGKEKFSLW